MTNYLLRARFPLLICLFASLANGAAGGDLASLTNHADVGPVRLPGSAQWEPATHSYLIAGSGENMWFTNDAFHFLWTQLEGDFSLRSAIEWVGTGGNAHRKACLMIRQSLAPDSAYVDVAVHGDGLISLQYRESTGALTREIQASQSRPARVGIERQGDVFFLSLPQSNSRAMLPAGPFLRLGLTNPVYAGLAVCAHDAQALEKARFSQVELLPTAANSSAKAVLHCTLETVAIASKDRRAVYHTTNHIEAPNWTRDGGHFVFNAGGHLYRLPIAGGNPEQTDTGLATRCNNDHGLSPDGKQLAISDQSQTGKSIIYVLPAEGGAPRQITPVGPSYWHGWSPDGKTLAYCAERKGEFDIYTAPVAGGEEQRLTTTPGLDDGPDYSPDGAYIYFNSERTGGMQVWRMKPDGSDQEQITKDEFNNWFPHPSPDGKWLLFLSYQKSVSGHPANEPVRLRLMPLAGGPIQELARLFGGQGTINVPSWSPDSRNVAFVSYELVRP